jgi:Flp pilus assembly protein CpaB
MIDTQILTGVLVAMAALAGLAIVLAVTFWTAASVSRPGQAPHGGLRRDLPLVPQPDADDARELVLR